ncbi:MAG: hypothetical protein IPI58_01920 [Alphaproteobacteria bacterium]|nr:MAG: hypothetical protein IPI58_01920 [Alphaproteobacteria bacterium]
MTDQPESTAPKPQLPPLPELEAFHPKRCPQELVDKVMKTIYDERPDLFLRIAEWERKGEKETDLEVLNNEYYSSVPRDSYYYIGSHLNIDGSVLTTDLFWEARLRARLMFGMSI